MVRKNNTDMNVHKTIDLVTDDTPVSKPLDESELKKQAEIEQQKASNLGY